MIKINLVKKCHDDICCRLIYKTAQSDIKEARLFIFLKKVKYCLGGNIFIFHHVFLGAYMFFNTET